MIKPVWPPPAHVRPVLRRARRRYHDLPLVQRPALHDPRACVELFDDLGDMLTLGRDSYWPLPPKALAWVAEPPADRARRRDALNQRVENVVRDVLAAELPPAVAFLVGGAAS